MESRFRMLANEGIQLGVALYMRARADFTPTVRVECRLRHDLAGDADGVAKFLPVLLMAHVVEQDARVLARVLGFELDAPAARRAHRADVGLETMLVHGVAAVVVDRHREEMELDVGPGELRARADETAGLELVAGADAVAGEQPLRADARLIEQLERRVQRHRLGAGVLQVHLQVILQVLADARQFMHQRDVQLAQ